jgi:tryptophan synthase alpha chain
MSRLIHRLTVLKAHNEKALVSFITAGDPSLTITEQMIHLLEQSGTDIIELGVPFSDPMADGPTIQLSSERALASGTTLAAIIDTVRNVRKTSEIPIILMGYLNPVYAYGYQKFCRDAVQAGIDGVLLVDMPPEEAGDFLKYADSNGLNVIFLLTPTSDEARIAAVNKMGRGFIYYVTVTGVTGARQEVSESLASELERIMANVTLPVMAGFGISTPEQAANVAMLADGVVVGSAIVKLFQQHSGTKLQHELKKLVQALKQAISSPAI